MLLWPGFRARSGPRGAGVGASPPPGRAPLVWAAFERVMDHVRRASHTPMLGGRSEGWPIPKVGAVGGGTKALRLIHGKCSYWNAFFHNLYGRCSSWVPLDCDYGFVGGRRREAAMVVPRVQLWRCAKARRPAVALLSDLTNAFACTDNAALEEVTRAHFDEDSAEIVCRRPGAPLCRWMAAMGSLRAS